MRFILIGNYKLDHQESMERFTQMLCLGLRKANFETTVWYPCILFGLGSKSTTSGLSKWLGYIDKWILFPIVIKLRIILMRGKKSGVRFHVCDHSNAPYLRYLPKDRTAITCHDVLAIRGALGHSDAYCPASPFGKILQKWILQSLRQAKNVGCVSKFTLDQLKELSDKTQDRSINWTVIYNGYNNDFGLIPKEEREILLSEAGLDPNVPFLLCVGSGLQRKNRSLLLNMLKELDNWHGKVCFAGEGLDERLNRQISELGLEGRILSVVKPSHTILKALYNGCDAFIFPSFSEGFGWPIIEAQACEAPVITSNLEPMPEVSGGAALFANPAKPLEFAKAFALLQNEDFKFDLIQKGRNNSLRFTRDRMINNYLKLHGINLS